MALDFAVRGSISRKAEPQTLDPVLSRGPPPPPPIPPTPGMYLPGPPPLPGVLPPRPIVILLDPAAAVHMDVCRSISLIQYISDVGVVPSQEDERRRERVVRELDKGMYFGDHLLSNLRGPSKVG